MRTYYGVTSEGAAASGLPAYTPDSGIRNFYAWPTILWRFRPNWAVGASINKRDVTITALEGSTSQDLVKNHILRAKLVTAKNYDQAVDMVLNDKADVMVADYPICVVSVLRYPDNGLLAIMTPLTYEPFGIAMTAGDPLMVNWVTNFLNTLRNSGTLELLRLKWVVDDSWLKELP